MDHEDVFLANVDCRISRASGVLPIGTPSALCPETAGGLKAPLPRPPAAGNNDRWSLHIMPLAQHSYLV